MERNVKINPEYKKYISEEILKSGYVLIDKKARKLLGVGNMLNGDFRDSDIRFFIESWGFLDLDRFMHDNGKYRYRKHAVFVSKRNTFEVERKENIPHFQKKQYNSVNGDVKRWFGKIDRKTIYNNFFSFLLTHSLNSFEEIEKEKPDSNWDEWFIEAHQFRIIASRNKGGLPTPEGVHKDGVSYVFIFSVRREKIIGGVSSIYSNDKKLMSSSTLMEGDCIYLDDKKVMHGVSEISVEKDYEEGYRDVLVITFRKQNKEQKNV